jgi:hypothetical protein
MAFEIVDRERTLRLEDEHQAQSGGEALGFAALMLLEKLSPSERSAYVG